MFRLKSASVEDTSVEDTSVEDMMLEDMVLEHPSVKKQGRLPYVEERSLDGPRLLATVASQNSKGSVIRLLSSLPC